MIARIPPLQLGLVGLCSALLLVLAWQIAIPAGAADVPAMEYAYAVPPLKTLGAVPVPSLPSFAEIDNRPLFVPARKPVAMKDDPSQPGAAAPFPSDIALVGIIIDGQTRLAMIRTGGAGFAMSQGVGSTIEGWQLAAIEPDHIVLQSAGRSQDVLLASNRAPASQAGPGAGTGMNTRPTEDSANDGNNSGSTAQQDQTPQQQN